MRLRIRVMWNKSRPTRAEGCRMQLEGLLLKFYSYQSSSCYCRTSKKKKRGKKRGRRQERDELSCRRLIFYNPRNWNTSRIILKNAKCWGNRQIICGIVIKLKALTPRQLSCNAWLPFFHSPVYSFLLSSFMALARRGGRALGKPLFLGFLCSLTVNWKNRKNINRIVGGFSIWVKSSGGCSLVISTDKRAAIKALSANSIPPAGWIFLIP